MNKFLLLIFSMLLFAGSVSAQKRKAYKKAADKAFEKEDYFVAYNNYKIILDKDIKDSVALIETDIDVLYKSARSAFELFEFEIADTLFTAVLAHPEGSLKTDARFYKGLSLYNQLEYDSAIEIFEEIGTTDDMTLNQRVQRQKEHAEWALKQKENILDVSPALFNKGDINTPYVDVASGYNKDTFYYTSVLNYDTTVNVRRYKPVSRVHKFAPGGSKGIPITQKPIDKDLHEANYVINPETGREYINYCTSIGVDEFRCKLYYRESATDAFKLMPDSINIDTFTTTHPAVGEVDDFGNETLYFVSDRPGSKKLDIWSVTLMVGSNKWSKPKNIEELNTEGDEITPFYHRPSKTFFLSSDGRKSMGNFDIYKSTKGENGWNTPENVGYPINDGFDNTHFSFNSAIESATFSSNCKECSTAANEKICKRCDDIYEYEIEVALKAYAFAEYGGGYDYDYYENNDNDANQESNRTLLTGVDMKLVDITGGQYEVVAINEKIDSFYSELKLERDYRLVGWKDGWSSDSTEFNTDGIFFSQILIKELVLRPLYKLEVYVFEKETEKPIYGAKVDLTEVGGSLIGTEVNDTGNDFYFDLTYGKGYSIFGSKMEFGNDSETVSVINQESPRVIKRNLYLEKPYSLAVDSIILYFKNDIPRYTGYNFRQSVTDTSYEETYYRYIGAREQYATGYSQIETRDVPKDPLKQDVYDFFEIVKKNYDSLQVYTENLYQFFEDDRNKNKAIEIQLAGFASPIAPPEYNKYLTERRLSSVRNYFERYKSGYFRQYIKISNPRLTFKSVPYGESKADQTISDSRKDRPRSTYSRRASRERKVKISNFLVKDYFPNGTSQIENKDAILGKRK